MALQCYPHCREPCSELTGNVQVECGGCGDGYDCRPGTGFVRTGAVFSAVPQLMCSADASSSGCASRITLPTQMRASVRFSHAESAIRFVSLPGTQLEPGRPFGRMAMHYAPPAGVASKLHELRTGQVLYVPRGWWQWVASDASTISVTLRGNHSRWAANASEPLVLPASCAEYRRCRPQTRHWYAASDYLDGPKNVHVSVSVEGAPEPPMAAAAATDAKCGPHCENVCDELNGDVRTECGACGEPYACRPGAEGWVGGVGGDDGGGGCLAQYRTQLSACVRGGDASEDEAIEGELHYWETGTTAHTTPLHHHEQDSYMWVVGGNKAVVLVPPSASAALLPTSWQGSVALQGEDSGVVADVGKRGYGDSYWEDPELSPLAPPSSLLLDLFLRHFDFPKEVYAHIRLLQYVFGPQTLVYGAKLTANLEPYIEIYIYAMDSNRPRRRELQEPPADLNIAMRVLRTIEEEHFGIRREDSNPVPVGALILSFEIRPDSYAERRLSAFDYYTSAHDPRCSGVTVSQHLSDGTLKGIHCAEDSEISRYYWRIYKTSLESHFYIGLPAERFLRLLRERSYPEALLQQLSELPHLEHAALEFCDNVDFDGNYMRSAFYGIL